MLGLVQAAALLLALFVSSTHSSPITSSGVDSCPGYKATNVVTTDSTLTADLSLNGAPCNVYGTDLADLQLVVEYQTGMQL